MKVAITSATSNEASGVRESMSQSYANDNKNSLNIFFQVSGVGMLSTCYLLTKMIFEQKPDLIIHVGLAGTFDPEAPLAKVIVVKDELIGDMGVEEKGLLKNLFDMQFQDEDEFPFTNGRLVNPWIRDLNHLKLDEVTGLTINEVSTRKERIEQLKKKYSPDIESMEGAALHYVCLQMHVPFIQIRAISNYIGERDKLKWRINDAFENLTNITLKYVDALSKSKRVA